MPTTDPRRDAVWFILDDQDPQGVDTWAEEILTARNVREPSWDEQIHALRALAQTPLGDDLPVRAFCLLTSALGLMFEIGCFASSSADWASDQVALLRALSTGALREEIIHSAGVAGVESTIVFSLQADDPDEPSTQDRSVYGQVVAAARQSTPTGAVDLVGRAIHDNPDVLELFTYPLISFLNDGDVIAAVQVE